MEGSYLTHFQKYEVKSIDRIIQTSIRVKCPQKECTWTGCIMDYQVTFQVKISQNPYIKIQF